MVENYRKKTTVNNKTTTKDYLQEVELTDGKLQAAYHSEGRYIAGNSNYKKWEFNLKDHLGNLRLVFNGQKKQSGDGYSVYIQQESHYYPFGMPIEGPWYERKEKNDYLYNGKEYNTDLGLNWSDYGARFYDPEIGRFMTVDPMAGLYESYSPYHYVYNNPISYIDPDGRTILKSTGGKEHYINDRYGIALTMTLTDELFSSLVSSHPGEFWYNQLDWSNYARFLAKSVSFDLIDESTKDYGVIGWLLAELGYKPASTTLNDLGEGNYGNALFEAGTEIGFKTFKFGKKGLELAFGKLKKASVNRVSKIGVNAKKMTESQIVDLFGDSNWHKTNAKSKLIKQYKKELRGSTNADLLFDKKTGEIFLKGNESGVIVKTELKF